MAHCEQCQTSVSSEDEKKLHSRILCEDCYIDAVWPPVRKMYYENDPAGFVQRMKDSYSMNPQQYH